MTAIATSSCPHCEKPLRSSLTRCPSCGAATRERPAPAPRPASRGSPVAAGASGDIAALARRATTLIETGGLTALLATLIATPVAIFLAGAGSFLALGNGWIVGIVGTFVSVFCAVALTIAGPLSAFLLAITGERPPLGRSLELALSRVPTLAWLLAALYFSQIAVALPFQLVGSAVHLPRVGFFLGATASFLLGARFGMLGVALSVVENAPFGKTIERVVEVGRGRFPLLLVAAGVPKLLEALPGVLAACGIVSLVKARTLDLAYGNIALLLGLVVAGLLLEVALAAATLCVLEERPAPASR